MTIEMFFLASQPPGFDDGRLAGTGKGIVGREREWGFYARVRGKRPQRESAILPPTISAFKARKPGHRG